MKTYIDNVGTLTNAMYNADKVFNLNLKLYFDTDNDVYDYLNNLCDDGEPQVIQILPKHKYSLTLYEHGHVFYYNTVEDSSSILASLSSPVIDINSLDFKTVFKIC